MPLKLSLGLTKKVGLPRYSSLAASCHVEFEVESTLLENDLQRFHQHARCAYGACAQAVQDELTRQQAPPGRSAETSATAAVDPAVADSPSPSHESLPPNGDQRASERQLEFARDLSRQIHGLGLRRLEALTGTMFNRPLAELSTSDASELIRVLREIRAGKLDLEAALSGAVP
jgi:hypothetical protein